LIAACVLPRLASVCAGIAAVDRAVVVVAGASSMRAASPSPHARVLDASDVALARGVFPGQRVLDAQLHAPDLQVTVIAIDVLVRETQALAELLYRHAPACEPLVPAERVCLPYFAVVVDLTGVPRSAARLLADMARTVAQAGHRAVIASSSSRAMSLAVAKDMAARPSRWGRALLVLDDSAAGTAAEHAGTRARVRRRLGIESLELDRDAAADLRAAGVATAQDLASLLRSGLVERLGASARRVLPVLVDPADALDVDAHGAGARSDPAQRPASTDVVTPWRPPEIVMAQRDLEHDVTTLEPLLFVLRPLVQDVLRRLEARGARLLELVVALVQRGAAPHELAVAFPTATSDVAVVLRVLHARLERAFLQERVGHDGVRGVALRAARTTKAMPRQLEVQSSLPSSSSPSSSSPSSSSPTQAVRANDAVQGLLAEFAAELGEGRVGFLRATRAPLPEHMTALSWPPGVDDDKADDHVAGQPSRQRRRPRPVVLDPRTAHGRFAVGWPWPLSVLPVPERLARTVDVTCEWLFCRLDGADDRGPYEREYRVVVFVDGRRALCSWDAETQERWLCGWFD
jgi:hypothetical protein